MSEFISCVLIISTLIIIGIKDIGIQENIGYISTLDNPIIGYYEKEVSERS